MENIEKIKKELNVILQNMGINQGAITPESDFMMDLGLDSLDKAELVINLESHFGISITDDIAPKIKTVLDAITYINEEKNLKSN